MTVRKIEPDQLDWEQGGNLIISQILTVSALESEIDRLACPPKPRRRRVYRLYDLTEEEIKIVDPAFAEATADKGMK